MTLFLLIGYALSAAVAFGKYLWDRRHQVKPATSFRLTPSRTIMKIGDPPLTLKITPLDASGNITNDTSTFSGTPSWPALDPAIGVVNAMPDGMSATFTPAVVGTDTIEADVTIGGAVVKQTVSIPVTAGPATSFRIDVAPAS